MEIPCYKCQAAVQEGIPFCPHCGAPQIRVTPPEGNEVQAQADTVKSGAFAPQRVQTPGSVWTQGQPTYTIPSSPIRWDIAWRGALLAGLASGLLSALPKLSFGFLVWLAGAGAIAVVFYSRRVPGSFVTGAMGLKIGALTGLFAFLLNAIGVTLVFTFAGDAVRKEIEEQFQASLAKAPDPKTQQLLQQLSGKLSSPEGMATFFVVLLLVLGVLFIVLAAAGGAMGSSLSRRRTGVG